ncbi:MAG: VCBS repeat-containing protein [Planctomycetes bacterium]|nr:VCBS repeat-containing protein [Planctomycetota bacterium]
MAAFIPASLAANTEAPKAVVVESLDGSTIEGDLLKEDQSNIYLYAGGGVITIPQQQVKKITTSEGSNRIEDIQKSKLYQTAKLPVRSVQTMVEELGSAVVTVKTPVGLGTGFFINPDGYLVTNNHVVAGERSITVTMYPKEGNGYGKKTFKKVRIIALNDDIDLALLKIEEPIELPYEQLYFGDSTKVKVGDKCFSIGNPMGLERSTSEGKISKEARNFAGRLFIQTTAPIAPGNSGGPFFNECGEIVGVVNMGYMILDGLGFAIPSKYVMEFLDNVESFAYDEDNPNSGTQYMEPPITSIDKGFSFSEAEFLKLGHGISCLTLADLNGDGIQEVVYANNNKAEIGIVQLKKPGDSKSRELDFEDINQLPESELFTLKNTPVASNVSSLVLAEMTGDELPDILFLGDIDGLAILAQKPDGTFATAEKLDDIEPAERKTALRVVDLDNDGKLDIFVLGKDEFTVFWDKTERETYQLGEYSSSIKRFELIDADGDNRQDVIFFSIDKNYAAFLRLQNAERDFVEEYPLRSHISGPVRRLNHTFRFITLDKGLNRARLLELAKPEAKDSEILSLLSLPVKGGNGISKHVRLGNFNQGKLSLLAIDADKNNFVVYSDSGKGFTASRSPAPRKISECELYLDAQNRAAVFSLSIPDRLFGLSRIDDSKITFPRPINTVGEVQNLKLETFYKNLGDVKSEEQRLCWIEKTDSKYFMMTASAEELLQLAYDGSQGSVNIDSKTISFLMSDQKQPQEDLKQKPGDFALADFNGDEISDLVIFWQHSGKESLYLGTATGVYREIIKPRPIIEEQKDSPLLLEDIDNDNLKEVLLVQPEFVRVLKVDEKEKLYVARQFNWRFGNIRSLISFGKMHENPRFIALSGNQAQIVQLDLEDNSFQEIDKLDLTGLGTTDIRSGDLENDGNPEIFAFASGGVHIFSKFKQHLTLASTEVFNAKLDYYQYWNLCPADIDGDGSEEILIFDSRKAMFEIYRLDDLKKMQMLLRARLFEKTIFQRDESDSLELPQELVCGDMDGNGKADIACILQDRLAIYLQDNLQAIPKESNKK